MKTDPIKRVTLEMSLKPFKQTDTEYIHNVCREALRQWVSLLGNGREISLLLWVAEGSEILSWKGDLTEELEWARYIGYMNDKYNRPDRVNNPVCGRPYLDNPATISYKVLKEIISAFKRISQDEFGRQLEVGATFDIGPEFARSDFKYNLHPEINRAFLNGREVLLTTGADCVCCWSRMEADATAYAGYPEGIPSGTLFGEFLGRQANSFMKELGYDYIWFSNGFGFSCLPWTYLGVNFDGNQFNLQDSEELKAQLIEFWSTFRKECPYPVEVRGTNFSTGIDMACDLVPLRELYGEGFFRFPPPNSPWGALDNDFGLELVGYMSRIAELPGTGFPFRYYINDPWYWQNPWWDYYNREPFDIFCPMSVSRVNESGKIENPSILELITIDTEKGQLDENCPMEVIPQINKAITDFPDAPGVLTWLYPFDEYSSMATGRKDLQGLAFFGDWLIRNAINIGLPLNTVCSSRTFTGLGDQAGKVFKESILCAPALALEAGLEDQLIRQVTDGGKVLLYGPPVGESMLELLNLAHTGGLSGECTLDTGLPRDDSLPGMPHDLFLHDPAISGGPLTEILRQEDPFTWVRAWARQNEDSRVFALTRSLPEWNGGAVSWIRGSLPFATQDSSRSAVSLPKQQDEKYADTSILLKYIMADLDYVFHQGKADPSSREVINFISRKDNGFIFSGFKHDTTVTLEYGFPDGAPIITGRETIVSGGKSTYTFDKSFHCECRIFIRQDSPRPVSCREVAPRPTALQHPQRRIRLTGLVDATVTIFPPVSQLREGRVEVNNSLSLPGSMYREEDYLDLEDKILRNKVRLENINGALEVSW